MTLIYVTFKCHPQYKFKTQAGFIHFIIKEMTHERCR